MLTPSLCCSCCPAFALPSPIADVWWTPGIYFRYGVGVRGGGIDVQQQPFSSYYMAASLLR